MRRVSITLERLAPRDLGYVASCSECGWSSPVTGMASAAIAGRAHECIAPSGATAASNVSQLERVDSPNIVRGCE